MRIDRLVIRGYGPLCDLARDFSAGAEGLHVVHGPNESGKSLSLRALEHGFPILCAEGEAHFTGIDTPEQYAEFVRRVQATDGGR